MWDHELIGLIIVGYLYFCLVFKRCIIIIIIIIIIMGCLRLQLNEFLQVF